MKRILVASDGSEAVGKAFDRAHRYAAEIKVLAVAQPPEFGGKVEIASGRPAEPIVMNAEQWGATLIVLGHRGRGLMGRWPVGSVARKVMHHPHCAVLIAG